MCCEVLLGEGHVGLWVFIVKSLGGQFLVSTSGDSGNIPVPGMVSTQYYIWYEIPKRRIKYYAFLFPHVLYKTTNQEEVPIATLGTSMFGGKWHFDMDHRKMENHGIDIHSIVNCDGVKMSWSWLIAGTYCVWGIW